MKIAIFHELPVSSGSRKAVNEIAKRLKRTNHVDLYFIDKQKNINEQNFFSSIYFYQFTPIAWEGNDWKSRLYRDTIELVKLYGLHKKIAKEIRKRKYDIFFVHASSLTESPFILQFFLKNTIYYAHAPNYTFVYESVKGIPAVDPLRKLYEKINRACRRIIDKTNVQSAKVILANSNYTKKAIKDVYHKKSIVKYLGVDTNTFYPLSKEKKYDVLFIGSYHEVDGYNLLIDAVSLIKRKLRTKIVAIEDGWISNDKKLLTIYNQAKIVVCLAHQEPFGLVAIEAMSCGIPVIAVNEAGYTETIKNNVTGYLIQRNPEVLASKITWLLAHPQLQTEMGKQGRKEVERCWSWDMSVHKIEQTFRKYKNEKN